MKRVSESVYQCLTLSVFVVVSLTRLAAGFTNNHLHGIGHVSITTDDLDLSTRFYTEVMGGMLITDLSYRYHGDEHYYLMFEKEITDAERRGVNPSELGVPDISSKGTYEVRGNFIVFDDGLIQLQSFIRRDITHKQVPFEAREPQTSSAYITAAHLCFLVKGDVNFNHYVAEWDKVSRTKGFQNAKANPTVKVSTEEERQNLSKNKFGITFNTEGFDGLSFASAKGPSGEQLEFVQLTGQARYHFGKEYCQHRSVSSDLLTSYNNNVYKQRAGITGTLQGLHHVGTRAHDFQMSAKFYTEVLGGKFLGPPLFGESLRGDEVYTTIFLKELFDARRWGVRPESLGIPDISDNGNSRIDVRFVLFDNYIVESVQYTNGPSLDDPPYNPRYNWSSHAYINSMAIAFQLDEAIDLDYYVHQIEDRALSHGFPNVRSNKSPDSMHQRPLFPTGSALEGYRYIYVKGPSGEQMVFTQFRGRAARILKQAIVAYGALSTAFDETNPWTRDEFKPFCRHYDLLSTADRSVCSNVNSLDIP